MSWKPTCPLYQVIVRLAGLILSCIVQQIELSGMATELPRSSTLVLQRLWRDCATLHVLRSGGVAAYEGGEDDDKNLPRPDPADGRVASEWVTERFFFFYHFLDG